jgi:UDP-glucose 4-epimerase
MASRGSVIPLFVQQIKSGQTLTITDPNMTRYLMNLDEAVELVLFAFENGTSGDIFVQKSPSSTIQTLVEAIQRVFKVDQPIKIIGTRHGEKLYETLLTREEMIRSDDLGNYFRVPADNRDLNYNKFFSAGETTISRGEDYNSHNTTILNVDQVVEKLLELHYIRRELRAWKARAS